MQTQLFPTTGNGQGLWQMFSPWSYGWTTPQSGGVFGWIANGANDAIASLASISMEWNATLLRLAIWAVKGLSDPSWLLDPVARLVGGMMHAAYANVFIRFVPLLLLIVAVYVVYRYALGHHAKMWQGIMSTVIAGGLIMVFFADFGGVFTGINATGNQITNLLGTSVSETAGVNYGSKYDALWDAYILYPWAYGQFGTIRQTSAQNAATGFPPGYAVTAAAVGQVYTDQSGNQTAIKPRDNWAQLFLENPSPNSSGNLMSIISTTNHGNMYVGQIQPISSSVNPSFNLVLAILDGVCMMAAVVFLFSTAGSLFLREIMFLVTIMLGIVTVPAAFIPEFGWSVTMRWVREAAGHLFERAATVVYATLIMALAGIITQLSSEQGVIILAPIINALIFGMAIIYRHQIFKRLVKPVSQRVRFSVPHQSPQPYPQPQPADGHGGGQDHLSARQERHGTSAGANGQRRHLSETFEHNDVAPPRRPEGRHFRRDLAIVGTAAATVATGGAAAPLLGEEIAGAAVVEGAAGEATASRIAARDAQVERGKDVAKQHTRDTIHRATSGGSGDSRQHVKGKRHQLPPHVRRVMAFGKRALSDHLHNALHDDSTPSTWEERAHRRESFTRHLEHGAHKLGARVMYAHARGTVAGTRTGAVWTAKGARLTGRGLVWTGKKGVELIRKRYSDPGPDEPIDPPIDPPDKIDPPIDKVDDKKPDDKPIDQPPPLDDIDANIQYVWEKISIEIERQGQDKPADVARDDDALRPQNVPDVPVDVQDVQGGTLPNQPSTMAQTAPDAPQTVPEHRADVVRLPVRTKTFRPSGRRHRSQVISLDSRRESTVNRIEGRTSHTARSVGKTSRRAVRRVVRGGSRRP